MEDWYLITGAAGGLGKAFCASCARRGFNLFLTDVSDKALAALSSGIKHEYGIKVRTFICNLASENGRDSLYAQIEASEIKFTGLINVAGTDIEGEFAYRSLKSLRNTMQVNMLSAAENINRVLCFRQENRRFTIINVASLAAYQPMPYKALYSATKRFLVHLSLGIREELKPYNVTVTALCPSGMPTTKACVECINAQGIAGILTTMNTGDVAEYTLKQALRGKALVIPGVLNKLLGILSTLAPDTLSAALVRRQWSKALQKRCGTLKPQENNPTANPVPEISG
ncbi:MAG: SDR family NAD(P)-dependent oxidoreductase [Bacillota bacterium]|nr:SDR family NAD(P)-dependent oxidoreductase [Bacillota bacterium]